MAPTSIPPPEWLPTGFPPRTFPLPGATSAPPPPLAKISPPKRQDRRQSVAFGLAVLVLALAVGGFIATRGGESTDDATAPTTTLPTTNPETLVPSTPNPTAPIETTTTTLPGTTTTAAGRGVLTLPTAPLSLPRTDATVGAMQAPLIVRNSGSSALTYTVESSKAGLSVTPTTGTLAAGASINLAVTLEGAQVADEGPFVGALNFGGTGGTGSVQVESIVGKPPEIRDDIGQPCPSPSPVCGRAIKLAPTTTPDPTPCNTPWVYAVTIVDQSAIKSTRVVARRGLANADTALEKASSGDFFLSTPFVPIPSGLVLRFTIEATDEFGFTRRLAEQSITCP